MKSVMMGYPSAGPPVHRGLVLRLGILNYGGHEPAPHAGKVEVFKARTNKWFAWLSWAVAAFGVVVTVVMAGPGALGGIAPLAFIAFMGWQLFWMPSVVVHDAGVTLENPFRSIEVPWAALVHVDTRFALTLVTAEKSYTSWAAPAPGIWGGRHARPEDLHGLPATTYGPGKLGPSGRSEDHGLRPGCHAGAGPVA